MHNSEFTFDCYNTKISGRFTVPSQVYGVVVLAHGFGEHSGRYSGNIVPVLGDLGMAIIVYDNIGHGKSGGKRGHCPSYSALLDILDKVVDKARETFPEKPLFLYGHSMGGNLVLNYALRRDTKLDGVIATSPYLRLAFRPPTWKMVLGRLMMNIMPSVTLPSGLDPNGISRISAEVEKYTSDSLVHDKVSPMFSFPVMEAGEWAIANAGRLKVDTLMLHGTGDLIIDYRGTEEFHESSNRTTLKLFEGGYHELHHDLCKDEMLDTVRNWLRKQL